MYDNYEIVKGGWRLPSARSVLPGTVIEEKNTKTKYVAVHVPPNMKEANRASVKKRAWQETEKAAAWAAFLPIVGAGLKIWVEYDKEDTYSIFDVWSKVDLILIILAAAMVALFALSAVAAILERKHRKAIKKYLKTSYYWKLVEEEENLLENRFPELAGLAKTEQERELLAKEAELEELIGERLDKLSEQREGETPVSDSDYL